MPKTSLGKPKVGECRITRKSGITYVYERTTQYSRKLHKTVTLSTRLLGKILPGTTEVVATRPRGAKGCRLQGAGARRVHVGLTSILEWAGRESGIDADLRSSLRAGEAEKVLSIARYWLGTGGHALTRMEGWQLTHELPYAFGVTRTSAGICSSPWEPTRSHPALFPGTLLQAVREAGHRLRLHHDILVFHEPAGSQAWLRQGA